MVVTELGIVTDVKLMQAEKAADPIVVAEFGMVMAVRPLQAEKA